MTEKPKSNKHELGKSSGMVSEQPDPPKKSSPLFRQSDIKRALRAILSAGLTTTRLSITPTGEICLILNDPSGTTSANSNTWDEVLE